MITLVTTLLHHIARSQETFKRLQKETLPRDLLFIYIVFGDL